MMSPLVLKFYLYLCCSLVKLPRAHNFMSSSVVKSSKSELSNGKAIFNIKTVVNLQRKQPSDLKVFQDLRGTAVNNSDGGATKSFTTTLPNNHLTLTRSPPIGGEAKRRSTRIRPKAV